MKKLIIFTAMLTLSTGFAVWAGASHELDQEHEVFMKQLALASKGDMKAELCVGDMYSAGWGVKRAFDQAFAWYNKAAAGGSQEGKTAVGMAYLKGLGVLQNTQYAQNIFQKLVKEGYMPAASSIGYMYMYGVGVRKNLVKAFTWYQKAAAGSASSAEGQLAMMYKNGMGVKANMVLARNWLNKLPEHHPDCMPDFQNLSGMIIFGNITAPIGKLKGKPSGKPMLVRFKYENGNAENIRIIQSSGYPKWDAALLQAVQNSRLPPWPVGYENIDKTITFYFYKENQQWKKSPDFKWFSKAIASAIMHSLIMPKHVLLYGSKGTDVATVSFEYLDGKVGNVRITKSSGDKYEDAEAIHAAETANYSPVPDLYKGQSIHFTIPINFTPFSPAPNPGTKKVPNSALIH